MRPEALPNNIHVQQKPSPGAKSPASRTRNSKSCGRKCRKPIISSCSESNAAAAAAGAAVVVAAAAVVVALLMSLVLSRDQRAQ